MSLMLFHGMEILGFMGGSLLGLLLLTGLVIWAFLPRGRAWSLPAAYLVTGLSFTTFEVYREPLNDFIFWGFLFAFPWSPVLVVVATVFDSPGSLGWFIPFVPLNALIIYLIARRNRLR